MATLPTLYFYVASNQNASRARALNMHSGCFGQAVTILFIAHIFSKFQTIKTLRRYSENMSWPDIVLKHYGDIRKT